jgi:hypothetical protein
MIEDVGCIQNVVRQEIIKVTKEEDLRPHMEGRYTVEKQDEKRRKTPLNARDSDDVNNI